MAAILSRFAFAGLQPPDFTLQHFADESRTPLTPNERIYSFAEAFRQADVRRFHIERRSSHTRVVTRQRAGSIGS